MIFVRKMPGSLGKKILTAWRIICSVLKFKILFMGSGGKKRGSSNRNTEFSWNLICYLKI